MKEYNKGYKKNDRGFTLAETVVIIGILLILLIFTTPAFRFFQQESDLNNYTEEIINILRFAQNKTLASERESSWGVYFLTSTDPDQYILFKGNSYSTRDSAFDEISNLSKNIEIYEINLAGGGSEVVFKRISGTTDQSGQISLRLKNDVSKTKKIIIKSSGQVILGDETPPTETNRIKDSRHIHFDYSRTINTTIETLTLTFEGGVTKDIPINGNMESGQIYWEGEVTVSGEIQKLKVHTHRLNNPDTQFSIHRPRDQGYNTKSLTITIIEDGSGSLISYTADGQESRGTSIFLAVGEAGDPKRQ